MSIMPPGPEKTKAVAPDQENTAFANQQQPDDSAIATSSKVADILCNKSTSTEVQLEKIMALLRQGPKTTIDLRNQGIMMPAARVHQLKHECNHTITSEWVTLYDANGFRHSKCARYHLVAEAEVEGAD